MSASAYPSLDLVDAAPFWLLKSWYRDLPQPRTDDEKSIMERIAIRADGCGLIEVVNNVGRVKEEIPTAQRKEGP